MRVRVGGLITYRSAFLFKMSKTSLESTVLFSVTITICKMEVGSCGAGGQGHLSARWKAGLTSDLIFIYEPLMSGHGPVV